MCYKTKHHLYLPNNSTIDIEFFSLLQKSVAVYHLICDSVQYVYDESLRSRASSVSIGSAVSWVSSPLHFAVSSPVKITISLSCQRAKHLRSICQIDLCRKLRVELELWIHVHNRIHDTDSPDTPLLCFVFSTPLQ